MALRDEIIRKLRQISLTTRLKVASEWTGESLSRHLGRGIDFEEFREYVPGDDVRHMAWNVTARFDRPFVKVFREDRDLTVFLLVDISASLDVGSPRTRRERLIEFAAMISYLAMRDGHRVGLLLFAGNVEKFVPAKRGEAHIWRILSLLAEAKPKSSGTNMTEALNYFERVQRTPSACFLMSDFYATGFAHALRRLGRRHDLIVVKTAEDFQPFAAEGYLTDWQDAESKQMMTLNPSRKSKLEWQARRESLSALFNQAGADEVTLYPDTDPVLALKNVLMRRESRA